MREKIKVLVVDDSPFMRKILCNGLSSDSMIEVVGEASDPYMARDLILKLRPDAMTLDIDMPKMNGVEFLKKLMPQFPIPTIIVSSLTQRGAKTTIEAMDAGAVEYIAKPSSKNDNGTTRFISELKIKIKVASLIDVSHWKLKREGLLRTFRSIDSSLLIKNDHIITIGASTGGTEAIKNIVETLPANFPAIVIVQHMPKNFTKAFAERLNLKSRMTVVEASDEEPVLPGKVIIAQGGKHIKLIKKENRIFIKCFEGEKVNGHCPSVSVLFNSAAKLLKGKSTAVMLTGMGADGADGMLNMKNSGAFTIAQDEESSIVYGMPKAAYDCGAVHELLPLDRISMRIVKHIKGLK